MMQPLFLHEEFMLLALHEDAGTVVTSESIEYPLAAALLAELVLQKRLELTGKDKKDLRVRNVTSLGDPVLDEALQKIRKRKKPESLGSWVERLAGLKNLKNRTAQQLCKRGILRADEDKVLLLFTRKIYPEIDPGPERRLVERLRATIFGKSKEVDPRDAVIIALAHQTHLLKNKFDQQDLKSVKDRIEAIAEGSLTARAAQEVVDSLNTVMIVAVMMPIIFD
jgi:hypothetical protein